jgi:hypothetical protein
VGQSFALGFYTASTDTDATERMRIDSSGNVGIGASSISAVGSRRTLQLNNSAGSAIRLSESGTDLAFLSYDSTNFLRLSSSDQLAILTAGTERMRIDSSGRVGIGETNPDRELDLKNSADNCIMSITSSTSHLSGLVLGDTADDDRGGILYNNTSDYLYFLSNAQERLRILSGGGITFNGDTATANALDDYEEGTWTPVYTPANNSFTTMTMNVVSATYTKIGRQVTARAYITTNEVVVGTASGGLNIDGLPFTSASGNDGFSSVSIGYVTNWGTVPNTGYVRSNNTEIRLRRSTGANDSSPSDLTTGATANQNQIMITATYFV